MSPNRRPLACALVLALASTVVACSESKPGARASSSHTPTSSTSTPQSPAAPKLVAPKGWKTLAYQRIAFAYPPVIGTITAGEGTGAGPRYAWTVRRTDRCDPRGTCRSYELAAVNDACPPTGGWPTYVHRWITENGKHFVTMCEGKSKIGIAPVRIVRRTDGLEGVIYNAGDVIGDIVPGSLAAVFNFPKGFHKSYEAIAFYFEDPTPLETIETALRLITLG